MKDKHVPIPPRSREKAVTFPHRYRRYIAKMLKKKTPLYEPLEYESSLIRLTERLERKLGSCEDGGLEKKEVKDFLEREIKTFLIREAYFTLEADYIRRIVMRKTGAASINDAGATEALAFITESLEKNDMERLRKFKEESQFKTYLTTVVNRLYIDFWRKQGRDREKLTSHAREFIVPVKGPLGTLLEQERELTWEKAAAALPGILETLEDKERLAIHLKYKKNLNVSAIARTLGETRFKTDKFITQIEQRLAASIGAATGGSGKTGREKNENKPERAAPPGPGRTKP